jgi:hypothetical protein
MTSVEIDSIEDDRLQVSRRLHSFSRIGMPVVASDTFGWPENIRDFRLQRGIEESARLETIICGLAARGISKHFRASQLSAKAARRCRIRAAAVGRHESCNRSSFSSSH